MGPSESSHDRGTTRVVYLLASPSSSFDFSDDDAWRANWPSVPASGSVEQLIGRRSVE